MCRHGMCCCIVCWRITNFKHPSIFYSVYPHKTLWKLARNKKVTKILYLVLQFRRKLIVSLLNQKQGIIFKGGPRISFTLPKVYLESRYWRFLQINKLTAGAHWQRLHTPVFPSSFIRIEHAWLGVWECVRLRKYCICSCRHSYQHPGVVLTNDHVV